ncbi:MAG: hypothetical protein QOI66_5018 [Myxococcales bacterium]|jgi:hypothetical protein|nr:hypothetical protein [Myxococcales bacterium]
MMASFLIAPFFALTLLGVAPPVDLGARFEEARALFDSGRYPEAAALFERLRQDAGDPALLYPAAQSWRLAGRCPDALAAYEGFVAAGPDLRSRAAAAKPGSDVRRLSTDLLIARGRTIEMQICAAGARSETARAEARRLALAGEGAAAVVALQTAWTETQDPTLLVDLAALHRARKDCPHQREVLDSAELKLAPLEALADDGAPSLDLLAARRALQEARAASQNPGCVQVPPAPALVVQRLPEVVEPPPLNVTPAAATDVPATVVRKGWPLWGVGLGGGLLAAGGACLWKAHSVRAEVDSYIRKPDWVLSERDAKTASLEGYNTAGIVLVAGGAVIGSAALIYYLSSKNDGQTASAALQVTGSGATFLWTSAF